jgi:AraC-like DNA-binding protein
MILSHQRWAWGDAEVARDRALWPTWTLRRIEFRGVLDDERALLETIGRGVEVSRASLTVVLDGVLGVWSGHRLRDLRRGEALLVAPLGSAPGCNLGGIRDVALELEWSCATAPIPLTPFRLSEAAFEAAAELAEALHGARADESARLTAMADDFLRRVGALGIAVPGGASPDAAQPHVQRVMSATDDILCRLDACPQATDLESRLGCSRWTVTRLFHQLHSGYAMYGVDGGTDWRSIRDYHRLRIARMLMTHPRAGTASIARHVGYRSPEAMCHAFAHAGLPSPGSLRDAALRAQ